MSLFSQKIYTRESSKTSHLWILLAAFLSAFSIAASAHAATYYVSTSGSDSGNGSEASPFKTIAHAVDIMVAGDTTYVKGGVYNEQSVQFQKSGTASAHIKLLAAPGEKPVMDFESSGGRIWFLNGDPEQKKEVGFIDLEGFEIRNSQAGIQFFNAHDVTIRHNYIHDIKGQGLLGYGKDMLIDSNTLSNIGGRCIDGHAEFHPDRTCNQYHGMYLTGTNWVITNNVIANSLASGIQVAGYPWCPPTEDCYGGGGKTKADPGYAGATGWLIANNTFSNNGGPGITVWQKDAHNIDIVNNIFYENATLAPNGTPQGISFYGSGGDKDGEKNTVKNNMFFASGAGGTSAIGGNQGWNTKFTESGSINADPMFVNPNTGNFGLEAGSPALGAGIDIGLGTNIGASGSGGFVTLPPGRPSGGSGGAGGSGGGGLGSCYK